MSSKEWMIPLNFAISFHVLLALATLYLPGLFDSKPKFEDIYTVNLINIADVPFQHPEQVEQSVPAEAPVEKVNENAVSIAKPPPVAPQAPQKAISLKPSKRKIKRKVPEESTPKRRDLSALRRQKLAEMIRAEQTAAEEARILAEEANIEKRLAEAAKQRLAKSTTQNTNTLQPNSAPRSSGQTSALQNQYAINVKALIEPHFRLPEHKVWPSSLMATLVIVVNSNGSIANSFFEPKSGDRIFDRVVVKALQDAGQLPPIPAAMKTQRIEIGLVFTPGGITNQ